jgi:hypothetical protein
VVGTPWQGHGIATQAVRTLIAWLGQQSVPTVIAHIHPRHQASAAVAAAAGLTPTGQLQDGENEVAPDHDAVFGPSTGLDNCSHRLHLPEDHRLLWSQIHGLGANVIVPRLESTPCDDVHSDAQEVLQVLEQTDVIKERRAWLEIHEQIYIAV